MDHLKTHGMILEVWCFHWIYLTLLFLGGCRYHHKSALEEAIVAAIWAFLFYCSISVCINLLGQKVEYLHLGIFLFPQFLSTFTKVSWRSSEQWKIKFQICLYPKSKSRRESSFLKSRALATDIGKNSGNNRSSRIGKANQKKQLLHAPWIHIFSLYLYVLDSVYSCLVPFINLASIIIYIQLEKKSSFRKELSAHNVEKLLHGRSIYCQYGYQKR